MRVPPALLPAELSLMCRVFQAHPEIVEVRLFGSRAKGTQAPHSDVDLAVLGHVDALEAEGIAAELDDLALPYHYDVKAFEAITFDALRQHIERVGISIYP